MTRRLLHALARLAAAVVVTAIVVVPVVAMARIAGNPFTPATVDRITERRVDDTTIVKLLSVGFYAVWAWVVAPAIRQAHLCLTARRATSGTPLRAQRHPIGMPADRNGPRAWLARLVRFALTSTLVTTVTATSTLAFASPATVPTASHSAPATYALVIDPAESTDAARPDAVADIRAHRRDTPYAIAMRLFPDRVDEARDEIVALNHGRPTPDGHMWRGGSFPEGMTVVVPASAAPPNPESNQPADRNAAPTDELNGYLPAESVIVEHGDNVWNLTKARLDIVDGPDARPDDPTIAEHVERVIDTNSFRSGDPNLIYPGESIDFPALGTPPGNGDGTGDRETTSPVAEEGTDAAPDAEPVGDRPPDELPSHDVGPAEGEPADDAATNDERAAPTAPERRGRPLPPPTTADSRPPSTARVTTTGATRVDALDKADSNDHDELAGITGAVVLASALAGALALQRRRRRVRADIRTPSSSATVDPVERAIVAASDIPFIRWASQELAALVRSVGPAEHPAVPVAVELDPYAGIEVLWDQPVLDAPRPWEATDGGWSWRTLYDPDEPTPLADWPSPMPSLVTVGQRGGRQLLLDLEHIGTLSVTGPKQRVEAFLHSVALELATGDDLADAIVYAVGLEIDQAGALPRVRCTDVDGAVAALAAARNEADRLVGDAETLFQRRLGPDPLLAMRSTVVLVGCDLDAGDYDRVASESTAGRGVAAVLAADLADASARLELADDGSAQLAGISTEPLLIRAAAIPAALLAVVTSAGTAENGAADPEPAVEPQSRKADYGGEPRDATASSHPATVDLDVLDMGDLDACEAALVGDRDDWDLPEPAVLVRVLGTPTIEGHPEVRGVALRLLVYLACQQGPVSISRIRNAVWGGAARDRKTVSNKLSELRAALGTTVDGEPLLAPATSDGVALHPSVMTDLRLCELMAERANEVASQEAIDLLREALALVYGEPFDAAGYEWADADMCAHDVILRAASQLYELACDTDDLATARHALVHGLKGVPGHEELYRLRMQLEHRCVGARAVHATFDELTHQLDALDCDPSDETVALYEQLTGRRG